MLIPTAAAGRSTGKRLVWTQGLPAELVWGHAVAAWKGLPFTWVLSELISLWSVTF